ncbi:MAG: antitoxin family protein [Desulfurococcales archaeon]|nr:antitoxin family protein [Desulfurococcales archaeon]
MSKIVKVRYEKGVLKPLEKLDLPEGEVLLVKFIRTRLAEKVFGSIRVDSETLKHVLREAEDELGVY